MKRSSMLVKDWEATQILLTQRTFLNSCEGILHIPLEQASDPELWMEIHHGGSNSERSMESDEMDEHQSDEEM